MDLIELRKEKLILGMSLNFTLRDEKGIILLAKGNKIASSHQLESIRSRGKIFVEIDESEEGVRVMMSGIIALNQFGAPIKDFSNYLELDQEIPEERLARETLFKRWDNLESGLGGLLANVDATADFQEKLYQMARSIERFLLEDSSGSLFLLFNRAVTYFRGYSVLHSLLCATLAHSLAGIFGLSPKERRSLVCAALTMNVAMMRLQDTLTMQQGALSQGQRDEVDAHPDAGKAMLLKAGVTDENWLEVVARHHAALEGPEELVNWLPVQRMTKILQTVDRYTAAMSPRKSRTGRTARDSVRSVVVQAGVAKHDEVGTALVRMLGLSPPGTFVKLTNGETAVVIRRGVKPGDALVASVMNRMDEPIVQPRLHDTAREKSISIESTLTAASARVNLNMDVMQRLLSK